MWEGFSKKELTGEKKNKLFFFKINNFNTSDTLDAKKKENSSGFFGNKTLSRGGLKVRLLKNYKKAQKKRIIFSKLKKYISKTMNYREKNLHKEVMIISKLFAETLVFKSARKFSIAGGPRKRLSRNLKRAFKSKSVKQIVGLIWFWEKVARMLTFFLKILR